VAREELTWGAGNICAERRIGLGTYPEERRTEPPSRKTWRANPGTGLARGVWRFRVPRIFCIACIRCIARIRRVGIIVVARIGVPVGVLVALVGMLAAIDVGKPWSTAAREGDEQDSKPLLRSHGRRAYRKAGRLASSMLGELRRRPRRVRSRLLKV
jgi:hypothetical protein